MSFRGTNKVTPPLFVGNPGYTGNIGTVVTNRAYMIPFVLPIAGLPIDLNFFLGVGGIGNMDIGIYTYAFQRLWSTGSFATPAAGAWRTVAYTGSKLQPMSGFLAMVWDNGTINPKGTSVNVIGGQCCQSGAGSLPLPATLAGVAATAQAPACYMRIT